MIPIPDEIKKQLKLYSCFNPSCHKTRQLHEEKYKKCARCRQAWYCSVACQTIHWKHGHKDECKAVNKKK